MNHYEIINRMLSLYIPPIIGKPSLTYSDSASCLSQGRHESDLSSKKKFCQDNLYLCHCLNLHLPQTNGICAATMDRSL